MSNKCPKCQHVNPDNTVYCGKCASPLPSSEDIEVTATIETPKEELTTGSTFAGRYQIIEELGKGGMGRVYKVLDKEVNAKVALKLIKPEIASDKKTIERFRNELKVARDIAHKNVCRMYDLGKEAGAYYITMEYVSGEDLKSFIRRSGFISVGKAIAIANQVCEGLLEAHRLGVVHRDLKPQNIMIDKDGNARIMDFGIARSLRAKGITGSGVMIGTPEYMSPEQVEGKEADQRADIYSLGVILYEMVTGKVPFEGDTPFSIGVKQKNEIPRPPKEINEQIPEDLNRVILKCMEKEKESRYQSVGELYSELTNLEKGIPTTDRVVPERKPLTSREITVQFNLKKLFIPALVIIAVVIIGLILWQILPSKKAITIDPSGKPSLAVMYFKNNTGDSSLDHWRAMLCNLLITDLTQSKHINVLSEDKLFSILSQLGQVNVTTYSSEDLKQVATLGGVNHILQGAYARAGEEFRISVTLQEANSGKLIDSESVAGKDEQSIFTMVDELTRKIKANFELSEEAIESDIDKEVKNITTSSPEALKYYIEAKRFYHQREWPQSIAMAERAIEIDPEFAMAYRILALSNNSLGLTDKMLAYLEKAMEFSTRLPEREQYIIQAQYYMSKARDSNYDKALDALNKLLKLYPDDMSGNLILSFLYGRIENLEGGVKRLEFIRNKGEATSITIRALVNQYRKLGHFDKAEEVLQEYLKKDPESAPSYLDLAWLYIETGKFDLASKTLDTVFSLKPTEPWISLLKGDVHLYEGEFDKAENAYLIVLGLNNPSDRANAFIRLFWLYILQGRYQKAKDLMTPGLALAGQVEERRWKYGVHNGIGRVNLRAGLTEQALENFDKAMEIALDMESLVIQRNIIWWRSNVYLTAEEIEAAENTAEELKKMVENHLNKRLIRSYYSLKGLIELQKSNYPEAIEYLNRSASLLHPGTYASFNVCPGHRPLFFYYLGVAYYRSGELIEAQTVLEKVTTMTTERLSAGNYYAKAFYMLGKIFEEQGNTTKAIAHYEKFLDLWKDADPGISEVDDARNRVRKLKQ